MSSANAVMSFFGFRRFKFQLSVLGITERSLLSKFDQSKAMHRWSLSDSESRVFQFLIEDVKLLEHIVKSMIDFEGPL